MRFLALLVLLWPAVAFGQDDTADDTAEPVTEDTGWPLLLPADTVLTYPDDTEDEFTVPTLAVPLELPSLAKGIVMVPHGSHIILLDEDGTRTANTVSGKYWLLPDSYYREAVTKAKQLPIYEEALTRCTTRSLAWQQRTADAYDACLTQFDGDEELIASQVQEIATWETQAHTYKDQRDNARRQRNVAWAVTGGLILGASTVIVVAVAP